MPKHQKILKRRNHKHHKPLKRNPTRDITGEVDLEKRKRNQSPALNLGNLEVKRETLLKRKRIKSLRRLPRHEPLHHLLKKEGLS